MDRKFLPGSTLQEVYAPWQNEQFGVHKSLHCQNCICCDRKTLQKGGPGAFDLVKCSEL